MSQSNGVITPKFLTSEKASLVTHAVYELVFGGGGRESRKLSDYLRPSRGQCHVVVLVPAMTDHRKQDYPDWPDYPIRPVLLYENSFLNGKKELDARFDEIARCKALQLWTDRHDGGTDTKPHLLFSGDAPFWGGVKRDGIVVACSGVQPAIDRMIAGMIADMLVATAYQDWKTSDDKADDVDFLY